MKYENIEDGDDKDDPGSNYELENMVNGMKYEGQTGKSLKKYLHENYVVRKGRGRGEGTGGIADAIKEFGHEVFIARRTFLEPDRKKRLDKEAQEIMEKNTIMEGYNRRAYGSGPSITHPSTIEKLKEIKGDKHHAFGKPSPKKGKPVSSESIQKRLDTMSNKTQEEKDEIYRKGVETKETRTDEEKEITRQKWVVAATGVIQSPESIQKIRDTINAKSDEEKEKISKKISDGLISKLEEEKSEMIRKRKETMENKSQEEKDDINKRRSKSIKTTYENKPNSEKEEVNKRISDKLKGTRHSTASYEKARITMLNKSPQEKSEEERKRAETRANKTSEEKADIIRRSNEGRARTRELKLLKRQQEKPYDGTSSL